MAMDIPAVYNVILAIVIGTLFAIVYSMRILVLLERRIARMDFNLMRLTEKLASEEKKIEKEEINIKKRIKKRK
ncbi:hypothetical protein COV21_01960 [Candidatus Woesearchaeota archaeon CG10_big_fil_rev_8_21_14_0_10_45_5]|nr:MAG: hypothetical protein COV21_01960 [Candidatus Woesearchaeota archaeon CG10_big_fil_rev_8_21_14_0_10_45_5]PIU29746.1 MAG: hypothetical protein COT07_04275 [Candidatus Woesearchaeota archaeon CG07_land_8_20_14_0_80_44_23]